MYFPTTATLRFFLRRNDPLDEFAPLGHLRGRGIKLKQAADRLIQLFILERQRKFVNGVVDISHFDDRVKWNVTEKSQLLANFQNKRFFGSAEQHVRLEADLAKFCDTLLRRLGFEFSGGLDEMEPGSRA